MLFLQSIYEQVEASLGNVLNHFPLVRLVFFSLDKTIFYFLFWLVFRSIWLFGRHKKGKTIDKLHEFLLSIFVFYMILLYALTVFRGIYFIWDVKIEPQPISAVNFHLFEETLKLKDGLSKVDFLYNFIGNILWFIPFGFLVPYLSKRKYRFIGTVLYGLIVSLSIETMQFLLYTGISDVDDLVFNTLGTITGYSFYLIGRKILKKNRKLS